jgi:hypothetical protein
MHARLSYRFNVELSPMASASFSMGKPGEEAVELARLVERCLRGSGALDLEALCVLPGRKVGAQEQAEASKLCQQRGDRLASEDWKSSSRGQGQQPAQMLHVPAVGDRSSSAVGACLHTRLQHLKCTAQ